LIIRFSQNKRLPRKCSRTKFCQALDAETLRNRQIVQSNILFDKHHSDSIAKKKTIFLSLHNDVWHSIINQSLFNSFDKTIVGDLVEMYELIAEINAIISSNLQVDVCFPTVNVGSDDSHYIEVSKLADAFVQLNEKIIDLRKELRFDI